MFTDSNPKDTSLNDSTGQFLDKFNVDISKQALDKRFSEASVKFLKSVLESLLKKLINEDVNCVILDKFETVKIKDSTAFQLPPSMQKKYAGSGGSGSVSMIRIQFEYDYKTGHIYDLSLHPFNSQDKTDAKLTIDNIIENDLIIRDLGYVSIFVLNTIQEKKAFFLNRINYNTNVYEKKNGKYYLINFCKIKKQLDKNNLPYIEKYVYIGAEKFGVRIIFEYLPDAAARVRLSARKNNGKLSDAEKARISINIFITNVESKNLPAKQVRTLYRLRWQIELIFKVWKSVGEIQKIKKMKIVRFETLLYAKLLWICMNWKILWQLILFTWEDKKILLSPIKVFKTLKNRIYKMWQYFSKGTENLTLFIKEIYDMSSKRHKLEKRKKQLSSLEIVLMMNL